MMTQIMMVQPAAPPAQAKVGELGSSDSTKFSSHLDNAIKSDSQLKSQNNSQPETNLDNNSKENLQSDISSATEPIKNSESAIKGIAAVDEMKIVSEENIFLEDSITSGDTKLSAPELKSDAVSPSPTNPIIEQAQNHSSQLLQQVQNPTLADQEVQNQPLATQQVQTTIPLTTPQSVQDQPLAVTTTFAPKVPAAEYPPFTFSKPETASLESFPQLPGSQQKNVQGQEALLSQIQKIIDNSSETGTVSIKNARTLLDSPTAPVNITQTTLAATTSPEPSLLQNTLGVDANMFKTNGEKSGTQLTSLRQDTQQQYYEAKISLQGSNEQNTNTESNQKSDSSASQSPASSQGTFTQTTTSSPAVDYSQAAATVAQTTIPETLSDVSKPIVLPSGTVFTEDDIIQQLAERFQITKRQLETKLNIKLHPAELGELKIDITVKEGSIRANVVAQSLHVQQIIEKNIAKLKAVFENQGFSIDEILVTSESESVGDFDFFDKSLSRGTDYVPQQMNKEDVYTDTEFTLEGLAMNAVHSDTGVDIKA